MNAADTQRLFFALWPDDVTRSQFGLLQERLDNSIGRRVAVENLHVTVLFLGSINGEQRRCVSRMASGLNFPPFSLTMDGLGYWSRPQVVWAGANKIPDVLQGLVAGLREGTRACGLRVEDRPYAAHLTLLRKVRKRPKVLADTIPPITWPVESFCLMESVSESGRVSYHPLESWPLKRDV